MECSSIILYVINTSSVLTVKTNDNACSICENGRIARVYNSKEVYCIADIVMLLWDVKCCNVWNFVEL